MNAAQALNFIVARLQPDTDPVLSPDDVVGLLDYAAAPDTNALAPSHEDWVPTYTVPGCHYAIAEGFDLKLAMVPGRFDFTTDGQNFLRSQTVDHLEARRAKHLAKCQRTLESGPTRSGACP